MPQSSKWLLAILLFSLLINTWGITWGLPERWHPDELTQRAENMVGTPSLNPHFFVYGGLHHYGIAAFAVLPVKGPNKFLHLFDYNTQSTVVVTLSRLLSALMGTSIVLLIFLIGDRLFGRRTGLFAAALLAACMLLVNLSHFATADVPSLFWFTLSCLLATHVFQGGTRRSYFLAGLCSGLAAAVKYIGGLSLVVLVAAHWLRGSRRHKLLLGALSIAVGSFVLGNPVLLFAPLEFGEGFVMEMVFASARGYGLPRAFVPLLSQVKEALGLPVFLLCFAGLAYGAQLLACKKTRASVLLAFSMMLPYYVVIGSGRGPRAGPFLGPLPPLRYTLPLLPFLLLFAAKMLSDLVAVPRREVRGLGVVLFGVALCCSILFAAAVDLQFTHDSRYAAQEWILAHVKAGATIETTSYGPNIPHDRYVVVERPHDNQVAEVAKLVSKSDLRVQELIANLQGWLATGGTGLGSAEYLPWYRKALAHSREKFSTFDISSQGLELRSPDVLVVSDLYFIRFHDRSSGEGLFFDELLSNKTSYKKVAEFHSELPSWLQPATEFLDPNIYVYSREPNGTTDAGFELRRTHVATEGIPAAEG